MIILRGDTATSDRRLDRVVQFDEKSRAYPIRALVENKTPRSYTWQCAQVLDQGEDGACVGFSWSHELIAKPVPVKGLDDRTALALYHAAQGLDEWPGSDYDGTSVLGGAKAVKALGHMTEYRWAFGIDDLILALGHHGPGVLGINWLQNMFDPDPKTGLLNVSGDVAGGHAILVNGVDVKRELVRVHNSWGANWAKQGEAFIKFADLQNLLKNDGEFCIPVVRK